MRNMIYFLVKALFFTIILYFLHFKICEQFFFKYDEDIEHSSVNMVNKGEDVDINQLKFFWYLW